MPNLYSIQFEIIPATRMTRAFSKRSSCVNSTGPITY